MPAVPTPKPAVETAKPAALKQRFLVCTHGNLKLLKSAIELAKNSQAELLVLFVRHLAVHPMGPLGPNRGEDDAEALALFNTARQLAAEQGLQVYCLYSLSNDIADTILEMAVTHGVSQLVMGSSQRGGLWRAMKGDVIDTVAQYLPESISLMILA